MSDEDIQLYKLNTYNELRHIDIPYERHQELLGKFHNDIIRSIGNVSSRYVQAQSNSRRVIPGWNDNVREHRLNSVSAHSRWVSAMRTASGPLYDCKQQMRRNYKNAIERVKFHEDENIRESMARKLVKGTSKCFWSDEKRINNTRMHSNIVEGLDEPEKICGLWTNHYN